MNTVLFDWLDMKDLDNFISKEEFFMETEVPIMNICIIFFPNKG